MDEPFKQRLEERLDRIDTTLARNTESLEYHIRRTDDLQELVQLTSRHVIMVQGVFKAALAIAVIGTAAGALLQIFWK